MDRYGDPFVACRITPSGESKNLLFLSKIIIMSDFQINPAEGSLVTEEMIAAYAKHYGWENNDDQRPGIIGAIEASAKGEGELDANLYDAEATRELFAPVRSAYFKAKGVEEPGYSQVDSPKEGESTTE